MKDVFLQVFDGALAWAVMSFEQARFEFAHAAGDFGNAIVYGSVDIIADGVHLDGDMVGAMQDDFGFLPGFFFYIQDDLGINDSRVVEVEVFYFFLCILTHGFSDRNMTSGNGDRQIYIMHLHGFTPWLIEV